MCFLVALLYFVEDLPENFSQVLKEEEQKLKPKIFVEEVQKVKPKPAETLRKKV